MEWPKIQRILFVCTGNTCRSVMAEYLARKRFDPRWVEVESAGLRIVASETTANAVHTLRSNFGIDASAHVPRVLEQVNLPQFTLIFAIDDPGRSHVFRTLKAGGVSGNVIVPWKIDDPYGDDPGAYDRCAIALKRNLIQLEMRILNPKDL